MTIRRTISAIASRHKRYVLIILGSLFLASCSHVPFTNKNASPDSDKKAAKTESIQGQTEKDPKPGDIRVVDGVEYIYAKNRRYMSTPYEPEYIWMRKDRYSPGLFDSLRARAPAPTKEEMEMEARIAKLEEQLKKSGASSSMAPRTVPAPQPVSVASIAVAPKASLPTTSSSFPSPKIKRHVLVLPITGSTDPASEQFAERITNGLVAKLEGTGMIICVDAHTVALRGDIAQPKTMKDLEEVYGIQAVVKSALADTSVTADAKLSFNVYNAETGLLLRQFTASIALLKPEQEAGSLERIKQIDLGIERVAEDVLKSILALDWHARIASTEQGKIFINAGRLSGLEKGDILEVYAPGEEVIDMATRMPLGKLKGEYKGEIEIAELFGMDAAWVKPKRGERFSTADLVYLKR